MGLLDDRKILTREKRLNTLSIDSGTIQTLLNDTAYEEIRQRVRTFSQSSYDEIIYAIRALSKIKNSVIIIHGAIGCSAAGLFYNRDSEGAIWYSTNLDERDTILGGDTKLKQTIIRAYEENNPDVIFIVGTPVVAINNDDINAVIIELSEEIETKILSIDTDGFKSRTSLNGYDIALHAIGKFLINKNGLANQEDKLNVISVSENKQNIIEILRILRELGIQYNLFPQYSSVSEIARASSAAATVTLNDDEGNALGEGLEEKYFVPYLKSEVPIGLSGTRHFIKAFADRFGAHEKALEFIEKETKAVGKLINKLPLKGKKVYLNLEAAKVFSFVSFVNELGGEVVGITTSHIDIANRNKLEKLTKVERSTFINIADGQPFEIANALGKLEVDYYIGEEGNTAWVANLGIIPIALDHITFYGYEGIRSFLRQIKKAEINKNFILSAQANHDSIYKEAWLKKSNNWYIKQEVK